MHSRMTLITAQTLRIAATLLAFWTLTTTLAAQDSHNADGTPELKPSASSDHPILKWMFTWADGQDDEEGDADRLTSDRPDFTQSTNTVGARRLQVEGGYTYTYRQDGDPSDNVHNLPELLVRYGVAERLELRCAWSPGIVFESRRDADSGRWVQNNGSDDVEFGFKYMITKQKEWFPQTAVLTSVTAPIGSPSQGSQQVDAGVDLLYSWDLTEKLSLSCSTGNMCTRESLDHITRFHQSASLGFELTEKLSMFNECYVLFCNNAEESRPKYYYDGGFTYLVTPNFQLDWRAGVGLNAVSDGFFTGCGAVVRWR